MSLARLVNCPGCGEYVWERDDLRGHVTLDPCPWLEARGRPMNWFQRFMRHLFLFRLTHDVRDANAGS